MCLFVFKHWTQIYVPTNKNWGIFCMEVNTDNIFQVQCAKYCLIQMNMWEFYALLAKNVSVLDDNPRAGFGSLAANVSLNLCQKCVKSH